MKLEKFSDLPKRIGTAIIGGALFLYLLLGAGPFGMKTLMLVLTLAMLWEWGRIVFRDNRDASQKRLLLLLLGGTAMVARWQFDLGYEFILSLCMIFWTALLLLGARRYSDSELGLQVQELLGGAGGLLWVWLPLQVGADFGLQSGGAKALFFFFIVNWSVDVGAYFCGRFLGKRPLFSAVSPKKSIEGALGAFGVALIVGALLGPVLLGALWKPAWAALLALTVAVFAQLGDLAESLVKRAFQVKDSSGLLPGHGGFLDRFDGVLLSLPIMVLGYRVLSSIM